MSVQSLPRELVDKVVGYLVDKKDLASVSLVSSYLSPSTRPLLFSGICINPRTKPDILQDFDAFLTSCPHICRLILHLTFRKRKSHQMLSSRPSLTLSINQLDDILSKLPRLQSLHLNDVQLHQDIEQPASVHNAHHNLKRLTLTDAIHEAVVIIALGLFSHVDELRVSNHYVNSNLWEWRRAERSLDTLLERFNVHVPQHLIVSNLRLESNVSNAEFYTELLRRAYTSGSLASLTLDCSDLISQFTSSSVILNFLQSVSTTLTHLTLGARDERGSAQQLDSAREDYASVAMRSKLSTLTALRSLTLRLVCRHRATALRDRAFSQLTPLLLSLPQTLRQITFTLCDERQRLLGISASGPWSSPVFDLRALKPMLQRHEALEVVVFGSSNGVSPAERERITKELPDLAARGLVRFSE